MEPLTMRESLARHALCPLIVAIAWTAPGCGQRPDSGAGSPGDVLLITVDALRADHTGIYGYSRPTTPNLDRWFADGSVFERAYATASYTTPSVISLLSGLLPQEHGVRLFDQRVPAQTDLLTEMLPAEYQTAAFVANSVLTDAALGIGDRFDHYYDGDWPQFAVESPVYRAQGITDAALDWLRNHRDPGRPLFLWVHYLDPHAPYRPPDDWADKFAHEGSVPIPEGRIPAIAAEPGRTDALDYVDAYDAEIAYCDRHIGRLLDGYARLFPIDAALLLLTSDHGETLMGRWTWFGHMWNVFEELVRVPLLMRGPGVSAGRPNAPVSGTDLTPTILGFVRAPVPDRIKGRDLIVPAKISADRPIFVETSIQRSHLRGVIWRNQKWIAKLKLGNREVRARRRYDLIADPLERQSIPWGPPTPASDQLLELIASDPAPGGAPRQFERGELGKKARDALRELGYVE
jgi:arylsulfatase